MKQFKEDPLLFLCRPLRSWRGSSLCAPSIDQLHISSHCQSSLKYNHFYKLTTLRGAFLFSMVERKQKPFKSGSRPSPTSIGVHVSRRLFLVAPLGYETAETDGFLEISRRVLLRWIFQPPQKFQHIITCSLLGKCPVSQACSNPAIEKGGDKSPLRLCWV